MSKTPDDPNCRLIERAQQHCAARMGDTINKEDVYQAERELGYQLEVSRKK